MSQCYNPVSDDSTPWRNTRLTGRLPRTIALVTVLAAAACAALGAPSFRGYTGLVKIPTAQTLDRGEFDFGVMTEDTAEAGTSDVFGTYSPRDNVEIGVNGFEAPGSNTRRALINAKYQFTEETEQMPRFAIGGIDIADSIRASGYLVASKSLFRRATILNSNLISIRGTLGVGAGDIEGPFAGISIFAGNKINFSAEWDSRDMNLGFRFTPVKGLRLHAAIFDLGYRDDLGIGGSFTKRY